MYKAQDFEQVSFFDFNQSCGMQLDEDNEWIQLIDRIPWKELEPRYALLFSSETGHPGLPFRIAFGAYIIQKRNKLSDRGLVKAIKENPYYQAFLGLKKFSKECPFKHNTMVEVRKRLSTDFISYANDLILEMSSETDAHKEDENGKNNKGKEESKKKEETAAEVIGTAIIDATCSPSKIRYPQDYSLLNEAREKLEEMIDFFHGTYAPWEKPRTYRKVARGEYLDLAKAKKKTAKKIRRTIRKMLGYVKRDLGYIEKYMEAGYALPLKYINNYLVIIKLYEQQKYMFDNHTHTVEDRIVSISQPYIRPIVRGKVKTPVEFGAKYDVSIDEKGHARLEKISFDPYNENTILIDVLERYKKRTGHYPERVLVDKIYRTQKNITYCNKLGIRISGPKLGRPVKDAKITKEEKKKAYKDNTDRIEVERFFSLEKEYNGAGLITTKLSETTMSSIAMSVLVTNLFATGKAESVPFFVLYFSNGLFEEYGNQYLEIESVA